MDDKNFIIVISRIKEGISLFWLNVNRERKTNLSAKLCKWSFINFKTFLVDYLSRIGLEKEKKTKSKKRLN